jgi:hypothetical protein
MNLGGSDQYWLTPVKTSDLGTAEASIKILVGREHVFFFGEKTPGRKSLRHWDRICFYATEKGVVADARVVSRPEKAFGLSDQTKRAHKSSTQELVKKMSARFPLGFRLDEVRLYTSNPVVIDMELRAKLEAFVGRDPSRWSWFVVATHRISKHDFELLTRNT